MALSLSIHAERRHFRKGWLVTVHQVVNCPERWRRCQVRPDVLGGKYPEVTRVARKSPRDGMHVRDAMSPETDRKRDSPQYCVKKPYQRTARNVASVHIITTQHRYPRRVDIPHDYRQLRVVDSRKRLEYRFTVLEFPAKRSRPTE